VANILFNKDWHFNMLGIYNINKTGSFSNLLDFIKNNHQKIDGDIIEAGVYRGSSLLAIAKLLKDLGSDKKVYGFDTFSGFPPIYNQKDDISEFQNLFKDGLLSKDHLESVILNQSLLDSFTNKDAKSIESISSSEEFDSTNISTIEKKIDYLELDNIHLIKGKFSETMQEEQGIKKLMCGVIDCDLYESYLESLAFIWPKLSEGGFIHLDEYYSLKFPGARRAVQEFIKGRNDLVLKEKSEIQDFERWFLIKKSL